MRLRCCVCKKIQYGSSCSFFRIPTDERMRSKWSEICRIQFASKQSMICEDHFLSSDIIRRSSKNSLMPNAVPFIPVLHEDPIPLSRANAASTNENNISPRDCLDISMEVPLDVPETSVRCKAGKPQTNPISIEYKISKKNKKYKAMIANLQAQNKNLQAENDDLKRKLAKTKTAVTSMRSIFTEGQMKKMMTRGEVQWNRDDIAAAIRLHASGPKAYNYLYKKGFPLPRASMLEYWCRNLSVHMGFLESSLGFIKDCIELTSEDKICVLSFDEMKVVGSYGKGPVDYVQVIMAQGLWKSWKRPIFFDFDCQMRTDILFTMIAKLNEAGFTVVAMVCDMRPINRKLLNELGVTTESPWFPNPANPNDKVFTFVDASHLLEVIRYHFLETGLMFNNEMLTSSTIADVLKYTLNCDSSIAFELTDEHLSVKVGGQQLAAQLFSTTTANAIRYCDSAGLSIDSPSATAEFIELLSNWFDVLNSSTNTFSSPGKEPFGISLVNQQHTLLCINKLMSAPIIPHKRTLEYFQQGVIITNTALQMLYDYVRLKFNMIYILTSRLNQDMLKHVFWATRSKRGLEEYPTPMEFKYRLRKYILARNMEHLHGTDNVESDAADWLNSPNTPAITKYFENQDDTDEIDVDHEHEIIHEIVTDHDVEELVEMDPEGYDDADIIQEEGALAEYISGYAASD